MTFMYTPPAEAADALPLSGGVMTGPVQFTKFSLGTSSYQTETTVIEIDPVMTAAPTDYRPTSLHANFQVAPSAAPTQQTDYHGFDFEMSDANANVNHFTSFYSLEAGAVYSGSGSVNRLVPIYGFPQNAGSGTVADATALQANISNTSTGIITVGAGLRVNVPVNTGGGSIGTFYGIFIDAINGVAGTTWAIYSGSGAPSYLGGTVNIVSASGPALNIAVTSAGSYGVYISQASANNAFQIVQNGAAEALLIEQNAGGYFALKVNGDDYGSYIYTVADNGITGHFFKSTTGAGTGLRVSNAGTGVSLLVATSYSGAYVWQVLASGQVQSSSGNESTGAGSAALGANCPAATATAPYKWEKITTSDGSQCYFPVWK